LTPRLTFFFILLPATLLIYGCKPSSDSADVESETPGATAVENATPRWSEVEAWRVSEVPTLTIGSSLGADEYMLFRVQGAVRLSDKSIVVANGGTSEIRWFDSTGSFVRSAGRHGEGPGEFNRIVALLHGRADTIVVWDGELQRISVYSPSGTHARTVRRSSTESPWAAPIGMFSDGSLILDGRPNPSRTARLGRMGWDTTGYYRTANIGEAETVIARRPYRSYYGHHWARTVVPNLVVFSPTPAAAVAGDLLYYTKGERFEVEAYSPDGTLERVIRRSVEPERIRDGDFDRWVEWRMAEVRGNVDRQGWRRAFDESPREEFYPVIRSLHVDTRGNLWVEHYRPEWREDEPSVWSVFDATGQWFGDVEMSGDISVFQIGTDFVLGLRKDELGVETVVVFSVTKTR
jgi:hypothetical protein